MVQKADKFAAATPLQAGANNFAVQDIEGSEQGGGAVALAVMRLALRPAGP